MYNVNTYPTPEEIKEIQVEYYTSSLGKKHLAAKRKIGVDRYGRLAEKIGVEAKKQKDYLVIKIESKRLLGALDMLDRAGIKYEVPKKFELTEYVESKINK